MGSREGYLYIVNYESRKLEGVFKLHDDTICSISISARNCITGSKDCYLRVWPLDFSDLEL